MPTHQRHPTTDPTDLAPLAVSLATLAKLLDAHRSSVRRWLRDAGVRPLALGRGCNGAIRYRWSDVEEWLRTRQPVD